MHAPVSFRSLAEWIALFRCHDLLHRQQQSVGALEEPLPGFSEGGNGRSVDEPVVGGPADVHDGARNNGVVGSEPRHALKPTQGDNAELARHQDRGGVGATDDANVAQRQSASSKCLWGNLALASSFRQSVELDRNLFERLVLDVLDVWHHEAVRRVHGNTNVVRDLVHKGIHRRRRLGVQLWELGQCEGCGLDEQGHVAELDSLHRRKDLHSIPKADDIVHFNLFAVAKVGDGSLHSHGLDHGTTESAKRDNRVSVFHWHVSRRLNHGPGDRLALPSRPQRARCRSSGIADVRKNVLLHHPPVLPCARDLGKIQVVFLGQPPNGRDSKHLVTTSGEAFSSGSGGGGGSGGSGGGSGGRRWRRLLYAAAS
mmetsp:Transcript_19035/g.44625  ORF Transcript_19035/g.44625 Transcript_19035/m.44625 type:complete len:370 (-) Transcript_19035:416-1525(-)